MEKKDKKDEHEETHVAHDTFKKLLGYYGRDKRKSKGPNLLGMETQQHTFVPEAEEIERAMRDVEKEFKKGIDNQENSDE